SCKGQGGRLLCTMHSLEDRRSLRSFIVHFDSIQLIRRLFHGVANRSLMATS
ncbi:hypothetical protein TSMEX_003523, partial [Taenia solium]